MLHILVHWDTWALSERFSAVFLHLWCLFSLMVCFCSNIWLGLSLMSLFCPICHVFAVIQTGINGPRWPTHLGIGWKNSPVGALPFLALSKYIRQCVGRGVLCKPAPSRDVCDVMEAGQDYGGVFIVRTHCCSHGGGCSGQHVTLHPCDGWKLIQPPVWASAKGSGLTRTWCRPCGGFSGENLWCQKAEVKCCNLVYFETRGPLNPGGPRRHVTPDGFQVHCSKASAVHVSAPGAWMGIVFAAVIGLCLNRMFQLFHVQIYLHLTLLVSIYPSTQHSHTSSAL